MMTQGTNGRTRPATLGLRSFLETTNRDPQLLGLRLRFPELFPLLPAKRALAGQASKFRKAAFY
jgi:hypothetical protein